MWVQKTLKQQYHLSTSPRPLTPYTKQIRVACGQPKATVVAIMMLYKNTKVKVCSPDGDTDYFDIIAGVLQGDTLAPYVFDNCLKYVLRTSIDIIKDNGFKLGKNKKITCTKNYGRGLRRWHSKSGQYTNPNLLHDLERAAGGISLHVNADKTECIYFNERGDITTLNGSSLKLIDEFTYLGNSVSSTENDVNTWVTKLGQLSIRYQLYGSQTLMIK